MGGYGVEAGIDSISVVGSAVVSAVSARRRRRRGTFIVNSNT